MSFAAPPVTDNLVALINRNLLGFLLERKGVSDETLKALVAEKRRIAEQCRGISDADWAEMQPAVQARFAEIADGR